MDHGCLDDLTHLMTGAARPRRAVWQPLRGGAVGMVVLRLGPDERARGALPTSQPCRSSKPRWRGRATQRIASA